MFSRRSILGFFGSMPVLGNTVAKEVLETRGISAISMCEIAEGFAYLKDIVPELSVAEESDSSSYYASIRKFLTGNFRLPKYKLEEIERNVEVTSLDIDLASLRSVSPSFVYHKQKQRNIRKQIADVKFNRKVEVEGQEFYKKYGFHL